MSNQAFLAAALAVTLGRLAGEDVADRLRRREQVRRDLTAPPALDFVATGFGLSAFEQEVVLLCAGVELDAKIAQACAQAHGDPAHAYATFSLALGALPDAHWSAVSPSAPLRRWHLVEMDHPDVPTASALRIDERILHALTGIAYLDPRVESLTERLLDCRDRPPAGLQRAANQLAMAWSSPGSRRARLHGTQRLDLRAVVAAAAADLGAQSGILSSSDLPTTPAERDLLARLCERETILGGWFWALDIDDPASDSGRAAVDLARRLHAPVAVLCDVPDRDDVATVAIDVPPVSPIELRDAWRRVLGPAPASDADWPDRLASQFNLGITDVAAVAAELGPMSKPAQLGPKLWTTCRSRARPALDGLAQRVEARADWPDLVLPPDQLGLLREMALHVRHRLTVFEEWGFAGRTMRGSGVAALFAGPSGTGKTFAAEVLAQHLDLDLYRVDLSRVVSKYIGETETNLRRIFDAAEAGGVVLLFDEADALFGKRSEVRDSHDRYANIEVSYLLQRMETYRGLAILTTNLKDAIDTAFLRRLRFVVQFPFPDAGGRADIWRKVFPPELPTQDLDVVKLSRLEIAGGTIRNIALAAAFRAAEEGGPVRMPHLLLSARTEYAKLGKLLTDAEVAGWTP